MARQRINKTRDTTTIDELITLARLQQFAPKAKLSLLQPIVYNRNVLDKFSINTPLRVSHFLGQCAVETAYFTTMFEIGSSAPYKGRGYIQLTGFSNYNHFGKEVNVDLIHDPDRAAEPDLAILLACLFWDEGRLNGIADQDDDKRISRAINRGNVDSSEPANNEKERIDWTERAKTIFVPAFDNDAYIREGLVHLAYVSQYERPKFVSAMRAFADLHAIPIASDLKLLAEAVARALLQQENVHFRTEGSALETNASVPASNSLIDPEVTIESFCRLLSGTNNETKQDTKFGGLFPQGINFVDLELGMNRHQNHPQQCTTENRGLTHCCCEGR